MMMSQRLVVMLNPDLMMMSQQLLGVKEEKEDHTMTGEKVIEAEEEVSTEETEEIEEEEVDEEAKMVDQPTVKLSTQKKK